MGVDNLSPDSLSCFRGCFLFRLILFLVILFINSNVYAASLSVYPTVLNFGTVPVGAWVTQSVSVVNNSDVIVDNIHAMVNGPSTFQLRSLCFGPLSPGRTCWIDVIYRPMYSAHDSAWVYVYEPTATHTVNVWAIAQ